MRLVEPRDIDSMVLMEMVRDGLPFNIRDAMQWHICIHTDSYYYNQNNGNDDSDRRQATMAMAMAMSMTTTMTTLCLTIKIESKEAI